MPDDDGGDDIDMHLRVEAEDGKWGPGWRWYCDCGARGQINYQSDTSTLYQGRNHIALGRCK